MIKKAAIEKYLPHFVLRLMTRIETSPLVGRLARGAFWSLAGSFISRTLGLLSAILVGRILGKVEFGEFGLIQNNVGMFGVLAGFGMGITANKHVAEFKSTDPVRAGRILALSSAVAWLASGIMALVLFLFAPWVAANILAAPYLTKPVQISALILFLSGVNGAQSGALSGFEAFKTSARVGLWTGLTTFPVMLCGASYWGLEGAVWALVISQAATCLLTHVAVWREAVAYGISFSLRGARHEAPLFWKFCLPAVLTGIVLNGSSWGASVLVVHQSGGYADMGVYNAAMRVKSVPDLLLSMILAPILPVLSEACAKKDMPTFQNALLSSSMLALVLLIPVALLLAAAPDLALLPYGEQYLGHPNIVQWMMLHSLFSALLYAMGNIYISTGTMWLATKLSFFYALIHLGLAWWWVPHYGTTGFVASMTVALVVANVPAVIILFQRLPEVMAIFKLGRLTLGCLTLFALCVLASRTLPFFLAVVAGSVAIVICLLGKYCLYIRPRRINCTSRS